MTGELVERLVYEMNPLEDLCGSSSDEDHPPVAQAEACPRDLQPRGFKELRYRVDKFSGKDGHDDFEVWVEALIRHPGKELLKFTVDSMVSTWIPVQRTSDAKSYIMSSLAQPKAC